MIRPDIFGFVVFGRHAFDGQLQVLAVGVIDLRNARPVIEHATKARRAGMMTEDTAGRMSERDRIDLVPVPRLGACGHCNGKYEKNSYNTDAPKHARDLATNIPPMKIMSSRKAGFKAAPFTSARSRRTVRN
jgi:hypothetical protein